MLIRLDSSFPSDVSADFTVVARDVLKVTSRRFRALPPDGDKPIICLLRDEPHPPQCLDPTNPTQYTIALTVDVTHRLYAKFAYQLGHELGHVWFGPLRTNCVVEIVAEAFSLEVLHDMAALWATSPPHAHWRDYASCFDAYTVEQQEAAVGGLPSWVQEAVAKGDSVTVATHLQQRASAWDPASPDRSLTMLGAIMLRREQIEWSKLRGVAHLTTPSPSDDGEYRGDLQLDPAKLSRYITELLPRLES